MQVASLAEARRLRVDNEGADEEDAEVDGVGEDDFEADVFDDFEEDAFRVIVLDVVCGLAIMMRPVAGSRTESLFLYKFNEAVAPDSFTKANRIIGSGRPRLINYDGSTPDEAG